MTIYHDINHFFSIVYFRESIKIHHHSVSLLSLVAGNICLRSTCFAVPIFHHHKSSWAKPACSTETPPSKGPQCFPLSPPCPLLPLSTPVRPLLPPPPNTAHLCVSVTRLLFFVRLGILYISVLRIHREADVVLSGMEAKDNVWRRHTGDTVTPLDLQSDLSKRVTTC